MTGPADTFRLARAPAAPSGCGGGAIAVAAMAALAALTLLVRLSGVPTHAGAAADPARVELVSLTPQLGSYFGTAQGVLVVHATDRALGLEDGDVILDVDGRQPTSGAHATRLLGSYRPGAKLVLRVLRQHRALNLVTTLPSARPAPPRPAVIFGHGRA